MSKGLEALEKLTNYGCSKMSEKIECKNIIEKELKDYEKLKERNLTLINTQKIVKKKVLPLVNIMNYKDGICRKGKFAVFDNELYQSIEITKEEYEILRRLEK